MPKRLRWRFTFAISPRFNSRRWNLQELCSVRRSTGWQSLVSYGKSHVTNDALKTASQNAKFQYEAKGRSPPGFSLQVSRFRTPARFLFQMVTYQFWLETVKTGGGATPWKCVLCPVLPLFHFYIFGVFYSLGVKLDSQHDWRMIYSPANGLGHRMKLTWVIDVWQCHVTRRFSPPGFNPPVSRFRTARTFWCEIGTGNSCVHRWGFDIISHLITFRVHGSVIIDCWYTTSMHAVEGPFNYMLWHVWHSHFLPIVSLQQSLCANP